MRTPVQESKSNLAIHTKLKIKSEAFLLKLSSDSNRSKTNEKRFVNNFPASSFRFHTKPAWYV